MTFQTLWFASNNLGKVTELKAMLAPYGYKIKSILDLRSLIEINGPNKKLVYLIKTYMRDNTLIFNC